MPATKGANRVIAPA